jgi:hypothetical protein
VCTLHARVSCCAYMSLVRRARGKRELRLRGIMNLCKVAFRGVD